MLKTLIIITGPTGIGKTKVGITLARCFNTEIVSADSRQIFRELSIGTAVPSSQELSLAKHHFIHSHSVSDDYNASKYENEALSVLKNLFEKYNNVIMVGGSMLYIDAVCKGIDVMPDADPEIRQKLKSRLETEGIESLRLQLKKLDPDYYNIVDLKNPARIIHGLEVCLTTGKTFSSFRTSPQKERPFQIVKIGLNCERETLHARINQRVDKMIEAGLEDEARSVYHLKHYNALNTVGYREWFAHFNGEISREKAIELIKRNSRRYARKQITWFKKDTQTKWFEPHQQQEIIETIKKQISKK
ncbi:tRNA (adenosine(37)-N6)-dimethylallyltransferase MiaA [Maribellus maritimus]|uniref:tRNA (adenosine(37)-N6)-dimethylallyltransferase MiaA n=1 Tax=Maribellus maritimus TaxID=2870838 RepID=UPI001EE9BC73|nr:tRNA (adenosine(37)-N6)-dimethylallyltransferase MiaA [Maribellus maritimus]MCG6185848.1 tRNA (adenosine(37)-N6)-dimethylallyltransferase MiaA [Maribellus maritimus]